MCNVTNPPACYSEPWCYVNAAACRLSTKRFERLLYFPGFSDLFFSHATCGGDRTDFANYARLDKVSGRPLSFVVPSVTCTPPPFPRDHGSRQPGVKPNARAPASRDLTPPLTLPADAPYHYKTNRSDGQPMTNTTLGEPTLTLTLTPTPTPTPILTLTLSSSLTLTPALALSRGEPAYQDNALPWEGILLEYFSELSTLKPV